MSAFRVAFAMGFGQLVSARSLLVLVIGGSVGILLYSPLAPERSHTLESLIPTLFGLGVLVSTPFMAAAIAARDRETGFRNGWLGTPARRRDYFLGLSASAAFSALLLMAVGASTALAIVALKNESFSWERLVPPRAVLPAEIDAATPGDWWLEENATDSPTFIFAIDPTSPPKTVEFRGERRVRLAKLGTLMDLEFDLEREDGRHARILWDRFHPRGPIEIDMPPSLRTGEGRLRVTVKAKGALMRIGLHPEAVVALEAREGTQVLAVLGLQALLLGLVAWTLAIIGISCAQAMPGPLAGFLGFALAMVGLVHPFLAETMNREVLDRVSTEPSSIEPHHGHDHSQELVFNSSLVAMTKASLSWVVRLGPDLSSLALGPKKLDREGDLFRTNASSLLKCFAAAAVFLVAGFFLMRRDVASGYERP